LDLRGRPGLGHARKLVKIIDHERPDVVHAVMYQAIQLCRLAKKRATTKFKLVSSPRVNYRTRSALTLLVDQFLRGADDLLITESEASRKFLLERLKYRPEKVRTVYNGVDLASWPISKLDRQHKRLELRLGAGELLLGSVGRLDGQKAHWVLVEAMARLKNRVPARCVIIGDGPRRAALEALIRRHHLEGKVMLLGERDDVTAWLSSLDAFVLPSLWEGLPNALLEAMALGLPVVASAVDGVPEVVADGATGLLVPPRDPLALAKKLAELCADAGGPPRQGQAPQKKHAHPLKQIPNF
jgi:glycosyltransferase involved in cell wall biosynthesis